MRRYQLLNKLGQGGMGVVYKAVEKKTGALCALKILSPGKSKIGREEEILRFKKEFRLLATLEHPNLIKVYNFGISNNYYYFTMEYFDGGNILDATQNLSLSHIYHLIYQLASALQYIHSLNILHLDIKPNNILVKNGQRPILKLLDFGIAGEVGEVKELRGTIPYMAPEFLTGKDVDHRADLYSMGILLYQLLTRRLPFSGRNVSTVVKKHLYEDPRPPVHINHRIPSELSDLVLKLLVKDREKRIQNCFEVIKTIAEIANFKPAVRDRFKLQSAVPFVGRKKELQTLTEIFTQPDSSIRWVIISGPPGIGKTRLASVFLIEAELAGALTIKVDAPGKTIVDLVNGLLDELKKKGDVAISALEERYLTNPPHFTLPEARAVYFHRLADWLSQAQIRGRRPWVILVEDVQETESPVLDLFDYLSRNFYLNRSRILILSTFRTSETSESNLPKYSEEEYISLINLSPLLQEEIRLLVTTATRLPAVAEKIIKFYSPEIAGNPLFLKEILAQLIKSKTFAPERIKKPKIVDDFLYQRIDRLPEGSRKLLNCAAIIGANFNLTQLRELGGFSETDFLKLLNPVLEQGIFTKVRTGQSYHYAFAHSYLRELIYHRIPRTEVIRRHTRYAYYLEKNYNREKKEIIDSLADHFLRSNNRIKAIKYGIMSGENGIRTYNYERAESIFASLIKEKISRKQYRKIIENLADIYTLQGKLNQALHYYHKMLRFFENDKSKRAHILEKIGDIYERQGIWDKALAFLKRAFQLFESKNDYNSEARIVGKIGSIFTRKGEYERGIRLCSEFLQKSSKKIGDEPMVHIYNALGANSLYLGRYQEASRYYRQGIILVRRINNLPMMGNLLSNLGFLHNRWGNFEKTNRYYLESLRLWRKIGDIAGMSSALNNLGALASQRADFASAQQYFKQALELNQRLGNKSRMALLLNNLGIVACESLDYEAGIEYFNKAGNICQKIGNKSVLSMALQNLGNSLVNTGRYSVAIKHFNESLMIREEIGEMAGAILARCGLGEAYLQTGILSDAERYFTDALKQAERMKMKVIEGKIYSALGELYRIQGNKDEASKCLDRAIGIFTELRNMPELIKALLNKSLLERVFDHRLIEINEAMMTRELRARYQLVLGRCLLYTDSISGPIKAIESFTRARELIEKSLLAPLKDDIYFYLGEANRILENFTDALKFYEKSIAIHEEIYQNLEDCSLQDAFLQSERVQRLRQSIALLERSKNE